MNKTGKGSQGETVDETVRDNVKKESGEDDLADERCS